MASSIIAARRSQPKAKAAPRDELIALMNVGKATRGWLAELGIDDVATLARQNADELYVRLQRQRGVAFDPCLHDTFRAAIVEANTGERRPWYDYTLERKRRQAAGDFALRAPGPEYSKLGASPKQRKVKSRGADADGR